MAKRALVVGINDYAPIGVGGPDLNGCINDASDMANTLVICGFPAANIRFLTNQNATRVNIVNNLTNLVSTAKSGDSIVFYYSGHGTRVANIGADFEVDGLDEAICPHDFSTGGFITDDKFKSIFSNLKAGVNFEVIFDCCHSGSGTRKLNFNTLESSLSNETARYLAPSLEHEFYILHAKEIMEGKNQPAKAKTDKASTKALVSVAGLNHVLWAACKDHQVSMEGNMGGMTRGYFTYHFCRALRATNGNITRKLLDIQVANALSGMGAAQVNQTEAPSAKFPLRIFS